MLLTLLSPSILSKETSPTKLCATNSHSPKSLVASGHDAYSNASPPLLPPELIETIIDEVGSQGDTQTLRSCSLVASTFVFRAQSHIFKTVDLDKAQPRKKYHERFHWLLVRNPYLRMHVRHLRIGDDPEDDYGSRDWGRFDMAGRSWIRQSKTIRHTLGSLPRLQSFSLTFNSEWTNWETEIPASTRQAFEQVFSLSTLRSVSLEFVTGFPVNLLKGLVAKLSFVGLSCVETGNGSSSQLPTSANASPKSLYLRGTSPDTIQAVSQALVASSSASPLRKLAITPTFERGFGNAIAQLIREVGVDLEEFQWLPSIHFRSSVGSIDISFPQGLRYLKFTVSYRKAHGHGPFPEVIRLLSQLYQAQRADTSRPDHLERITIECHCLRSMEAKTLKAEWQAIDKILGRPGVFKALKELKIELPTSTSSTELIHEFMMAFQDALPMTQEKGVMVSVKSRTVVDERFVVDSGYSFTALQ
ncbi:hypothetical protein CPC08DRAFT_710286 [Agrocybe pediades]|nr:hypothetical protein CPC08DRAFT_710286 [Agrocybe pediades]